jgi:hypothetical protein
VDLLVIMPHKGASVEVATKIRLACPRNFPMDLIVRSPSDLRRRLAMGDSFLREVTSKGIVLPESRTKPGWLGRARCHPRLLNREGAKSAKKKMRDGGASPRRSFSQAQIAENF